MKTTVANPICFFGALRKNAILCRSEAVNCFHLQNLQIAVDPGFPNAWKRAPFYARFKSWAEAGVEQGRFVFVRIGQRVIVVLSDRDTDIGDVGPEDEIVIERRSGPAGFDFAIEVKRSNGR